MLATHTESPLAELQRLGQSIWLDYIRRDLTTTGKLAELIQEGVAGLTSNPAIFEKAIAESHEYDDVLEKLRGQKIFKAADVYETLAMRDIQDAADLLRPVYDRTGARDGYVSLEVSPTVANDTTATIAEARRLWSAVNRPNLMVKVPATAAGIPAIEELTSEGINVNVTLLFSQDVYEQVAAAFIRGLERAANPTRIGSVASFFVSRVDTMVDKIIEEKLKTAEISERLRLESVLGRAAIANARLAYQRYRRIFSSPRWQALAARGAQTQRLLWASTSTKNPRYRDVMYVEELIGPDTVNTVPPATLEAFRRHGRVRSSLEENIEEAQVVMAKVDAVGISMREVTDQLTRDAIRLFAEPYQELLLTIEKKLYKADVPGRLQ
jgi:transaldolase